MERARREIDIEYIVEALVKRPASFHYARVLRDADELPWLTCGKPEVLGEVVGEFRPVGRVIRLAESPPLVAAPSATIGTSAYEGNHPPFLHRLCDGDELRFERLSHDRASAPGVEEKRTSGRSFSSLRLRADELASHRGGNLLAHDVTKAKYP